jgi:hypothetical protein
LRTGKRLLRVELRGLRGVVRLVDCLVIDECEWDFMKDHVG